MSDLLRVLPYLRDETKNADGQPPRDFVSKKKRLIYACDKFKSIVSIPKARVPIFRCVHKETNFECDISFLNRLGVERTFLMKFLFSLDKRLRATFMVIKYWGKACGIVSRSAFCSFSMLLIFVFYLQQLDPPILPSVKFLLDNCTEEKFCDEWQYTFCNDPSKIPSVKNNMSIKEILYGFFEFYSKFDYNLYVICPYLGKAVVKEFFKNTSEGNSGEDELAVALRSYTNFIEDKPKQNHLNVENVICVQDPLELISNVSKACSVRIVDHFIDMCETACQAFKNNENDSKLILKMIIQKVEFELEQNRVPKSIMKEIVHKMEDVTIDLDVSLFSVQFEYDDDPIKWFKRIKNTVFFVLENVCYLNISSTKRDYYNYRKKQEGLKLIQNFLDKPLQEEGKFFCSGYMAVFSRTDVSKRLQFDQNVTKNELLKISRYILDNISKNDKHDLFHCYIVISCHPDESTKIRISFKRKDLKTKLFYKSDAFIKWMIENFTKMCNFFVEMANEEL